MAFQGDIRLDRKVKRPVLRGFALFKRQVQGSAILFIVLSAVVGWCAGIMAALLGHVSHLMQAFLYGFSPDLRLSGLDAVPLWRLLALPLGGAVLALVRLAFPRRTRAPIDVIESSALYGGRIPARDTMVVALQTLISNGFGASVGLEAAYAQMGGGVASKIGQWLDLKRSQLRTLVGAGAGAAIGAAFGAPLTGSFYAFEIVLGAYSPASLAPVASASLAAVVAAALMQSEPFVIPPPAHPNIALLGYFLYALLGVVCAGIGIVTIKVVANMEAMVRRLPIGEVWRPVIGGLCLVPIAWAAPQVLSSGHGAMQLNFELHPFVTTLALVFLLKISASILSLSFGFRGGMFFASLFLGSMLGASYAQIVNDIYPAAHLEVLTAALVGMAALAVAIVGGPMTMSLMVLEVTHDFALTAAVVTAALCCSTIIRDKFGYSFSTWRLHLRGEAVRNPRDIGWMRSMTASLLMRRNPVQMSEHASIAELREHVPLGSTSRVVLTDGKGDYRGIVPTAQAYIETLDVDTPLSQLAKQTEVYVRPDMDVSAILRVFEDFGADDLAVVDENHRLLGMLTEKYVNRRYAEELERAQREFFGE